MSGRSTLWLIPARGGSKGIPDKNLKPFCGRSLVARAAEMALDSAASEDVVFVSTDSAEIKRKAERVGVEVPFLRPDELASDTASTYSVIIHALDEFKKRGRQFEKVVLLQPTSPLRNKSDILGCLNLWNKDIDMVVSVCEAKANPYFNAFETDSSGFLKISKGDGNFLRRQDAPRVWEYNGAVYVMSVKALLNSPISAFKKIIPFEMPASRSIDLDSPDDWVMAEYFFKKLNS